MIKIANNESSIFDWLFGLSTCKILLLTSIIVFKLLFLNDLFFRTSDSKKVFKIDNFNSFIGFLIILEQKLSLIFLKLYSITATNKAPNTRNNRVPSSPKVIYLLNICIIKIGLNNPLVIITKDKKKRVPKPFPSLNIFNQYLISLSNHNILIYIFSSLSYVTDERVKSLELNDSLSTFSRIAIRLNSVSSKLPPVLVSDHRNTAELVPSPVTIKKSLIAPSPR